MYATHPPTNQRVARARAAGDAGVFTVDAPASILFRDYPELCRTLTRDWYQATVKAFDPEILAPLRPSLRRTTSSRPRRRARTNTSSASASARGHSRSPRFRRNARGAARGAEAAREATREARAALPVTPPEGNQLARLIAVRELRAAQLKVIDPEHKNLMHDEATKAADAERTKTMHSTTSLRRRGRDACASRRGAGPAARVVGAELIEDSEGLRERGSAPRASSST